jgi:hypothetical protein
MTVSALEPEDNRSYQALVAGSMALLIAKTHKIAERLNTPTRLVDKDAHDIFRILIDSDTETLAVKFAQLLDDEMSAEITGDARTHLRELFASGPEATGSMMAGRAEEGIGEPATVALQTSLLAADLLKVVDS